MKGLKLFGIALSIAAVSVAFASGWTVSVSTSTGTLFGPSVPTVQTNVPFIINTFGPFNAPATQFVSTLPQVNFLTTQGNPNPILVGNGTLFTGGTYTAAYTITSTKAPLTGFNFVVSGFVFGLGQIIWTKKVVDLNTSQVLFNGSGVFSGAGYPGGINGNCHQHLCAAGTAVFECAGHRDLHRACGRRSSARTRHCIAVAGGARLGARACEHAGAERGTGRTAATPTREEVML
jgi:hypothetical protein